VGDRRRTGVIVRHLTPQDLFARLDEMIEWAKREKEALSRHSTAPVDFLPAASFWCEGRPHAVIYCAEPEHGEDLTRLLSAGIRHFHPECVCVVMEGSNRDRGTCALGFASDGLTVVEAQAFYSTVGNVPVFGDTERAPLAVSEFHPFSVGFTAPFDSRSTGRPGDSEALARALPRHRVKDVATGTIFGPYRD
jgi:hypothetical protein